MIGQDILKNIGKFSTTEVALFEKSITRKIYNRDDILLKEGEIGHSVFFILSGCFLQFQSNEITNTIIDLHLPQEWMFNQQSITEQSPSKTIIKTFKKSEVIELSLHNLHNLISKSPSFLHLVKIFSLVNSRTYLFDNSLSPAQKYSYIQQVKPLLSQMFPIKMIASYLKIAPETLSRVRANYCIS